MQTGIHFIILIWILKIPAASLKVMTANVNVTKWNCTYHGIQVCGDYKLKIGYTRSPKCVLSTESIFSFAQNRNQETFPLSSRNGTTFTYIPKSTSNARLIVIVLDNRDHFKATSCENLHLRHERGNTTFVHSDSYFAFGSAKYSFDIEIITVCSSNLCTGLLCNHCVTTTEQSSEPSRTTPLTTTSSKSPITTTSSTLTKKQRTPTAVITNTDPGEKPGTSTTRIALIVVLIAFILVLVIFLFKWWTRNNQINDLNTKNLKTELSDHKEQKVKDEVTKKKKKKMKKKKKREKEKSVLDESSVSITMNNKMGKIDSTRILVGKCS